MITILSLTEEFTEHLISKLIESTEPIHRIQLELLKTLAEKQIASGDEFLQKFGLEYKYYTLHVIGGITKAFLKFYDYSDPTKYNWYIWLPDTGQIAIPLESRQNLLKVL